MDKRSTERTRFIEKMRKKANELDRDFHVNRWTATWKQLTKECPNCTKCIPVDGVPCCWDGVAVKRLYEPEKRRGCQLVNIIKIVSEEVYHGPN